MSEIALPEDILQIIWKKFYSIYVVPSIFKEAIHINKNLCFDMNIFAMNYNVLRIMSGNQGLSYSS